MLIHRHDIHNPRHERGGGGSVAGNLHMYYLPTTDGQKSRFLMQTANAANGVFHHVCDIGIDLGAAADDDDATAA